MEKEVSCAYCEHICQMVLIKLQLEGSNIQNEVFTVLLSLVSWNLSHRFCLPRTTAGPRPHPSAPPRPRGSPIDLSEQLSRRLEILERAFPATLLSGFAQAARRTAASFKSYRRTFSRYYPATPIRLLATSFPNLLAWWNLLQSLKCQGASFPPIPEGNQRPALARVPDSKCRGTEPQGAKRISFLPISLLWDIVYLAPLPQQRIPTDQPEYPLPTGRPS